MLSVPSSGLDTTDQVLPFQWTDHGYRWILFFFFASTAYPVVMADRWVYKVVLLIPSFRATSAMV